MQGSEKTHIQRWNDYLCPDGRTLKNLAGIEDAEEWKLEEGFRAALGRMNIPEFGFTNASSISEELELIHETVFGECYEWAGQFRTVTMSKASEDNPDVISYFTPHEDIDDDLEYLNEYVQRVDWDSATFEDKRDELAKIHAELNRIHPLILLDTYVLFHLRLN
jgi:cell filamentation protein